MEMEEDEGAGSEEGKPVLRRNQKRKSKFSSHNPQIREPKKQKREPIVSRNTMGLIHGEKCTGHKYSTSRWSAERYKFAEENMLKIMKGIGAVIEKPVLRQKLRDKARKVIGDTGLLDHLLKRMAGDVAPGGAERFMRRHNEKGVLEYWLESADLVEMRKMAGVSDPLWKPPPPPGWKLGDNSSQQPICAMEIEQFKEDIDSMRRNTDEMKLTKGKASCVSEQDLVTDIGVLSLKEWYEEMVKRTSGLEKRIIELSQFCMKMEEKMEKLFKVEKATKAGSDGKAGCFTLRTEKNGAEANDKGQSQTQQGVTDSPGKKLQLEGRQRPTQVLQKQP